MKLPTASGGVSNDLLCTTFNGIRGVDWQVETLRRGPNIADAWFFGLSENGTFDVDLAGTNEVIFKVLDLAKTGYDPDYLNQRVQHPFTWSLMLDEACITSTPPDSDYNDDGHVGPADLAALVDCLSGPAGAAGFALPSQRCRNTFDFAFDDDVDLDDYRMLQ